MEAGNLILTRKAKQTIRIGSNVTVTIQRIKGGSVSVAVSAPRDVRVVRGELKEQPK